VLRSVTFGIGIILAVAAFFGYLLLGGFLAPPPYDVVVAVQDIPPYTQLDASMLGVDSQHLNSQVVRTLVQRDELDQYVGGFVTTQIYAGEPLRKSAVVSATNSEGASRLSLIMKDPNRVAMVIPVDPKSAPSQVVAGDYVDIVIGLAAGSIPVSGNNNPSFDELLTNPSNSVLGPPPNVSAIPTLSPILKPIGLGSTNPISGVVSASDMNLPVAKAVIRDVPVLATSFQKVPNPSYASSGGSFGGSDQSAAVQPAYVPGDIQSLTVSVPRGSEELLKFGLDNGKISVVLLPLQTGEEANAKNTQDSTLGISWNDVLALLLAERTQALNATATSIASSVSNSPAQVETTSTPPAMPSATSNEATATRPTVDTTATIGPGAAAVTTPTLEPTASPTAQATAGGNTIPTGLDWGGLLTPLLCGFVLLILLVVAIRFIRTRRRQNALV
jgi:SAF domain